MANKNEFHFVSKPSDKLICHICSVLARNPKQCEDCGNLFCSNCVAKNDGKPCRSCNVSSPNYFKDKKSEHEINDLAIKCSNVEEGCQWTGTIGTLDDHKNNCQFALVQCPNKCAGYKGIGETQVMRKDVTEHLKKCSNRDYNCKYCGKSGKYSAIANDHEIICEHKKVNCRNKSSGCLVSMEKSKMEKHLKHQCEYTEVCCTFSNVGCTAKFLRKNIKEHEENNDKAHLHLALKAFSSFIEEKTTTLSHGESFCFKLMGFSDKKKKGEVFYSEPFYASPGGSYKMRIVIDANGFGEGEGTHISVSVQILNGFYDDQLHWPFLGTVTFELLNQLEDKNHHKLSSTFSRNSKMVANKTRGKTKFIRHSFLSHDPGPNIQYLLDDTLYFRVAVELDNYKPWLCKSKVDMTLVEKKEQTLSNDLGTTVFKVMIYSSSFCSNPFYTSPSGYNVCIEVAPLGETNHADKHVSLYIRILEGAYDESISWPFSGVCTVTLLNQLEDDNHLKRTFIWDKKDEATQGSVYGWPLFIAHDELSYDSAKNVQYLKNDVLYFKATVTAEGHEPWLVCTNQQD